MPAQRPFDVVLYGATGFTGKLIARALEKRGVNFAVAGRNTEKVQALARSLKSNPPALVADTSDENALVDMAAQGRVLVSAAGPFRLTGMPVARAALKAGCHYLDTTGEQQFVHQVVAELDAPARAAGVAMSPAMGFDVVPGDVAAYKAAQALAQGGKAPWLKRVDIVYRTSTGSLTRGTLKSLLGVLTEPGLVWRGAKWVESYPGEEAMDFVFPGAEHARRAVLTPLAEAITVPRTVKTDAVNTWFLMKPANERVVKLSRSLGGLLMSSPMGELLEKGIGLLPEGPDDATRSGAKYEILARVETRDGRTAHCIASGTDPYGLTAELLALYAALLAGPGAHKKGVLSPSQLMNPDTVLLQLHDHPITFTTVVGD